MKFQCKSKEYAPRYLYSNIDMTCLQHAGYNSQPSRLPEYASLHDRPASTAVEGGGEDLILKKD